MTRVVRVLLVAVIAASIGGVALVGPVVEAAQHGGAKTWVDIARAFAAVVPPPLVRMIEGGQAVSEGSDGRLTILLLGSDTHGAGVSRTDTIMVMSVKGNSISVVSIPRDTARIPNPDGGTYTPRVNALVRHFKANGMSTQQALAEFERVLEHLLLVEIDYYAVVTFGGFEGLVREVEPISIRINKEIADPKYYDDPAQQKGVYFPESASYELFGWQPGSPSLLCNGNWQDQSMPPPSQYWCHRSLPFVRSRKGPSNSDFSRAKRQQDLVIATIKRVINRGSGGQLSSLVNSANGHKQAGLLTTNIPITMSNALDLYNRLNGANLAFQAVFSPPTYATHIPGGSAYELKLPEVRQVMKQHFGSTGTPPPTNPPTPAPTATLPGPTATPPPPTATPTVAPTLAPGQTPTVAPTVAPGQTPTVAPTVAPGQTATVPPTLAPGQTPSAGPTLAPGQTQTIPPTLAPGQTPDPNVTPLPGVLPTPLPGTTLDPSATVIPGSSPVAVVPGGSPATPGEPGGPDASPGGAVAQPGAEQGMSVDTPLVLFAIGAVLFSLSVVGLFFARRRPRPSA